MLGFSIHSNQYKFWRYWYPTRLTLKPVPSDYGDGYIWRWLWFVWGPEGSATLLAAALVLGMIGAFLLYMRLFG